MLITRKAEFSASHICLNPGLSEAENRALFGAAANPHGHGHNYVLEVTVEGTPDPVTGMVLDLKALKETLNREVVEIYDHRFLNREVAPFDHVIPTPENIAIDKMCIRDSRSRGVAASGLPPLCKIPHCCLP